MAEWILLCWCSCSDPLVLHLSHFTFGTSQNCTCCGIFLQFYPIDIQLYRLVFFLPHFLLLNVCCSLTIRQGSVDGSDPFFGYKNIVAEVLRELYLIAIISIFISSLGNRPQGSKWIYLLCIFLFMITMLVIIYLSGFAVSRVLANTISSVPPNSNFSTVLNAAFKQPAFRDLVISFAATYLMYFVASFAYLEPWHMYFDSLIN